MTPEDVAPPTTVECAHCGEDIVPTEAEHKRGAGIILAFACPKCRHVHPFGFLTARGVRLRERLRKLGWPHANLGLRGKALLGAYRRELRRMKEA